MSSRRLTLPILLVGAFLLLAPGLSPAPALAQEPEAHAEQEPEAHAEQEDTHAADEHAADEEHEAEPKPWYYWPAKWFNFIALAGLLYWVLVIPPPAVQDIFSFAGLKVILSERSSAIVEARDLAVRQSEEASQLLVDSEQRLTQIEEEVAGLVSSGREDAERESVRADEVGKQQAEKILQVAEREVTNERISAQRQLRRHVAELAVSMAERNLADHLTADDQDRLIREYLSRLGRDMA